MTASTNYSQVIGAKSQTFPPGTIPAANQSGRVRTINDIFEALTIDIASTISFGKIPSCAVPLSASKWMFDALGASSTVGLGIKADTTIALSGKEAFFVAATEATASAGSISAMKNVNIDKTGQPLWQMLGLASDPKKDLEIIATVAGAIITGTLALELLYTTG